MILDLHIKTSRNSPKALIIQIPATKSGQILAILVFKIWKIVIKKIIVYLLKQQLFNYTNCNYTSISFFFI